MQSIALIDDTVDRWYPRFKLNWDFAIFDNCQIILPSFDISFINLSTAIALSMI